MNNPNQDGKPARTAVHTVRVERGDCDTKGIVWFPNYFRWIDVASRNFLTQCGVPPWSQLEATTGVMGTVLVDSKSRFVNSASHGDTLHIHTSLVEWRGKSFVMRYRIERGQADAATTIVECEEVRVFAARRRGVEGGSQNGNGVEAVPIPDDIRRLCS